MVRVEHSGATTSVVTSVVTSTLSNAIEFGMFGENEGSTTMQRRKNNIRCQNGLSLATYQDIWAEIAR